MFVTTITRNSKTLEEFSLLLLQIEAEAKAEIEMEMEIEMNGLMYTVLFILSLFFASNSNPMFSLKLSAVLFTLWQEILENRNDIETRI